MLYNLIAVTSIRRLIDRSHLPDLSILPLWRPAELPEEQQRALLQVLNGRFQQGQIQKPVQQLPEEEKLQVENRTISGDLLNKEV